MSTPMRRIEEQYRKAEPPKFDVGDRVAVAVLVREVTKGPKGEEEKTRIQNFIGDVIAIGGRGLGRSFTVRRVVQGEGVERTFPLHSPLVKGVKVSRKGVVRRAKLYDLRAKSGKAARIKERRGAQAGAAGAAVEPDTDDEAFVDAPSEETVPAEAADA